MKKLIALLLALVMILSLAACGTSEPATTEAPETTAANETPVETPVETEEVKTVSSTGHSLIPSSDSLRILNGPSSVDLNATLEVGVIESVTGYDLQIDNLPSENTQEVLVMTVATSTDYDVVSGASANVFRQLLAQGAIEPLNEYIDAIAPELWNCITEEQWLGVSDENGNVYALPKLYTIQQEVTCALGFRMDLMEEAGITELPTTTDELMETLLALKEYYGDQYIILSGPYNKGTLTNGGLPLVIANAFGIYSDWMVDENGKVIYMTEHENFDDAIAYMTQLREAGILDPDWASNKYQDVDEKFASGKSIVTIASRESNAEVIPALETATGVTLDQVEYVGAIKGPDGTCKIKNTGVLSSFSFVPRNNADKAADFVNYIKQFVANQEIICIGEEGVHFNWDESGYPVPIQPTFTDERNRANNYTYFANMETFQVQFSARLRKSDAIWKLYTQCTLNHADEDNFVQDIAAFCPSEVYSANNNILFGNLNDYLLQLISGVKDLDSSLDSFTNDWKGNGGEEVRAELQAWYDTNYAQ